MTKCVLYSKSATSPPGSTYYLTPYTTMIKRIYLLALGALLALEPAGAMHIMEGFLPMKWCLIWYALSLPFILYSYRFVARLVKESSKMKSTFALSAAYVFILSALKMPSVAGSSSHLTGTTLGTLALGPLSMPLVGVVVLLFQALLLAHGGISTLGANTFSLAIAGPLVAYGLYRLLSYLRLPQGLVIFLATFVGSMSTYVVTSFQLAVVYPDAVTGMMGAAWKFLGIFAVTQVPLSILEGILTAFTLGLLQKSQMPTRSLAVEPTPSEKKHNRWISWSFGLLALGALALPILAGYVDIGAGTDDQAGEMIGQLTPGFTPTPFWESFEPSEALEPILFAVQVALGIALFAWGYYLLRRKFSPTKSTKKHD